MEIRDRIAALRSAMADAGIDAYIITGSDPHGSEIPPEGWRTREWISGFTGSAGIVALTADAAGLWTDFRYWIQASAELEGSGIDLFRVGDPDTPEAEDWLSDRLPNHGTAAFDGRTLSFERAQRWIGALTESGCRVRTDADLLGPLWTNRPPLPETPVLELSEAETGESRARRLSRLREALAAAGADTWIGAALDSAAWLLCVRGRDVKYNTVVAGFLIVDSRRAAWYTDRERLPGSLIDSLTDDGVSVEPYDEFLPAAAALKPECRILADPKTLTQSIMDALPREAVLRMAADPAAAMKAVKNPVQIARTRRAMEKDGAAMVRFLIKLEKRLAAGEKLTELEAAGMLRDERAGIPGYLYDSFSSIAAAGEHGALCHYEARSGTQGFLERSDSLFLIDSGGQWDQGTTDITRTLSLGRPSAEQRRDYTLVLKAHIVLSVLRFPAGTRGYQLDAITRATLWGRGIDFGHGTGHGVGYRLGVHEGPQVLNSKPIDVAVVPGMIVSNEPGIYREGRHGIRIENLLVCREDTETEFGRFLAFDTLTLAPYDRRLIDLELLSDKEINWIDAYHRGVTESLSGLLAGDERAWLERATAPLAAG